MPGFVRHGHMLPWSFVRNRAEKWCTKSAQDSYSTHTNRPHTTHIAWCMHRLHDYTAPVVKSSLYLVLVYIRNTYIERIRQWTQWRSAMKRNGTNEINKCHSVVNSLRQNQRPTTNKPKMGEKKDNTRERRADGNGERERRMDSKIVVKTIHISQRLASTFALIDGDGLCVWCWWNITLFTYWIYEFQWCWLYACVVVMALLVLHIHSPCHRPTIRILRIVTCIIMHIQSIHTISTSTFSQTHRTVEQHSVRDEQV